jgi:hypothetical protein
MPSHMVVMDMIYAIEYRKAAADAHDDSAPFGRNEFFAVAPPAAIVEFHVLAIRASHYTRLPRLVPER